MKKIIVAATLVGALITASVATAQKRVTTRKVSKTEQMSQSTAAPMEKKETRTTRKKSKVIVKDASGNKESKHTIKESKKVETKTETKK